MIYNIDEKIENTLEEIVEETEEVHPIDFFSYTKSFIKHGADYLTNNFYETDETDENYM